MPSPRILFLLLLLHSFPSFGNSISCIGFVSRDFLATFKYEPGRIVFPPGLKIQPVPGIEFNLTTRDSYPLSLTPDVMGSDNWKKSSPRDQFLGDPFSRDPEYQPIRNPPPRRSALGLKDYYRNNPTTILGMLSGLNVIRVGYDGLKPERIVQLIEGDITQIKIESWEHDAVRELHFSYRSYNTLPTHLRRLSRRLLQASINRGRLVEHGTFIAFYADGTTRGARFTDWKPSSISLDSMELAMKGRIIPDEVYPEHFIHIHTHPGNPGNASYLPSVRDVLAYYEMLRFDFPRLKGFEAIIIPNYPGFEGVYIHMTRKNIFDSEGYAALHLYDD